MPGLSLTKEMVQINVSLPGSSHQRHPSSDEECSKEVGKFRATDRVNRTLESLRKQGWLFLLLKEPEREGPSSETD